MRLSGRIVVVDFEAVTEAAVSENSVLRLSLYSVMHNGAFLLAVTPRHHIVVNDLAPGQRGASHHDSDLIQYQVLGSSNHCSRQMLILEFAHEARKLTAFIHYDLLQSGT